MNNTMPVIFFGHGNPMNALANNDFTKAWAYCGSAIAKPRAVISISAHWYVPGTFVTAMLAVPTPDHYLPLLYVIALQNKEDPVSFPVEGFDGGSVSMLTVRIG